MQNVDYIPQTRTHYDPAQRAAQWKQRVVREEDTLANGIAPPLSARSQAAGQRGSAGISDVLPGPAPRWGAFPAAAALISRNLHRSATACAAAAPRWPLPAPRATLRTDHHALTTTH